MDSTVYAPFLGSKIVMHVCYIILGCGWQVLQLLWPSFQEIVKKILQTRVILNLLCVKICFQGSTVEYSIFVQQGQNMQTVQFSHFLPFGLGLFFIVWVRDLFQWMHFIPSSGKYCPNYVEWPVPKLLHNLG